MVKRHRERRPIFSRYQIEEQIEGLAKNQTALPSGGSIVMDQTEALVAIDVNSGKMASESGIEATALKTNLEAAMEVGRQLRLRDLGGWLSSILSTCAIARIFVKLSSSCAMH